ncbi:hypothetical protein EMPS_11593 [Entomortierella parvispora]|uniref:Uncharacterized protein n=1 Tax=Entomortierella parvispora TaxID=205924 RepID=A0A9P3HNP9_9FUNG|nr:hypothetical protein EMPS_11593 [Entomortierella parvispora]
MSCFSFLYSYPHHTHWKFQAKMNIRKLALLLAMMTAILALPASLEKRCVDGDGDNTMKGCSCTDTEMCET